nr:MAG TPA: hypothetical protein [Caudoviricetes sp.]
MLKTKREKIGKMRVFLPKEKRKGSFFVID